MMNIELTFNLPIIGCKRCEFFETYSSEEAWKKGVEKTCKHINLCTNAVNLYKEDLEKLKELEMLK